MALPPYYVGIKALPAAARPRERLQALGPQALSDEELIAIILRTGAHGSSALDVARRLIVGFKSLAGLNGANLSELAQVHGMGPVKAVDLKASFELGKRLLTVAPEERPQITGPQDAYALLRGEMSFLDQESVRVIVLDTKHRALGVVQVSLGSLNSSVVRVAEVFREEIGRAHV